MKNLLINLGFAIYVIGITVMLPLLAVMEIHHVTSF